MAKTKAQTSGSVIPEVSIGGDPKDSFKWAGLNTSVKDPRFLPLGATYDENNWITGRDGDHIELRRGSALLGKTRRTGTKVTGLGVGQFGSTQVVMFASGRSIYWYNPATGDTQEVNVANILPNAANGEDLWFTQYQNLAGQFIFCGSPHSSTYKIHLASPGDVVDLQTSANGFNFNYAKVIQNRLSGLQRYGNIFAPDLFSHWLSNADRAELGEFAAPTIDDELATGDGVTKTFNSPALSVAAQNTIFNTLIGGATTAGTSISNIVFAANQATVSSNAHGLSVGSVFFIMGVTSSGSPVNGAFYTVVAVPDVNTVVAISYYPVTSITYGSGGTLYPAELFKDDGQGNLASNLGGVGTIDYATGAWSATFITAPANGVKVVANFYTENSNSGGITDFTFNSGSPSFGQAYQFQQGGGGPGMGVAGYQGVIYALHKNKSWVIGLPTSSASSYGDATNDEYWAHIGIPYPRAQFPTGDGVLFLDDTNPAEPKFSILEIPPGSTNLTVVPTWESQDLDLSVNDHSTAVVFRWGDYDILCCREYLNGIVQPYNSVFYVRNLISGMWDKLDYPAGVLDEYLGTLTSGDSLSPNLFTLFSGTDDDGNVIANYRKSAYTDLGFPGLKKCSYINVEGLIARSQSIQISISTDNGTYIVYYTILGTGSYVNSSSPVGVGSNTLGSQVIGGGGQISALPFSLDIPIHTDLFQTISFEVSALGVGWAQINRFAFKDIRIKRRRLFAYNEEGQ